MNHSKSVFRLFNLLFLFAIITLSACHKTNLSGHWHFFSGSDPTNIIHTWDIEGDTLIFDSYRINDIPDTTFIQIKEDVLIADIKWYEGENEYVFGFVDDTLILMLDDVIAGKAIRKTNCTFEEDALFSVHNNIDLLFYSEADTLSRYNVLSEIFIGKPKEQEYMATAQEFK